jgi:glycerate 2-kinase
MDYQRYRKIAVDMISAAVKAADPTESVKRCVKRDGDTLFICDKAFSLKEHKKLLLFSVGKASTPMASAFENIIKPDGGLVITKLGSEIGHVEVNNIPVVKAYHPEPKQINVEATDRIINMVKSIQPEDNALVVLLVSGGGSALFSSPAEGISVDDLHSLNQILMKWGGNIYQINTIRKHVDQVKGGRFAKLVADQGASLVSLILSDVVGDDLSVIASGPSVADHTSFKQSIDLLKQYKVWDECPESVKKHLLKGLENSEMESVRVLPPNVYNHLIGNNMSALQAAKAIAEQEGFNTMVLTSQNTGEAKEVAKTVMGIAKEIQDSYNPIKPPAALIIGGEMTVTFAWEERDGFGPNREFVLSSALEVAYREGIVIAAADTDGEDGQGKSGAIADCHTIRRSQLDPLFHLHKHEAEAFFDHLGDSLEFESRTNVNDVIVVLVGPKE